MRESMAAGVRDVAVLTGLPSLPTIVLDLTWDSLEASMRQFISPTMTAMKPMETAR